MLTPLQERIRCVLADLAGDKVLTLEARAEARDFIDFAALTARFTIAELCDLAAERDAGFHGSRLSDRLAAFGEIPAAEFARYALYRVDYDRLRATIAASSRGGRSPAPWARPVGLRRLNSAGDLARAQHEADVEPPGVRCAIRPFRRGAPGYPGPMTRRDLVLGEHREAILAALEDLLDGEVDVLDAGGLKPRHAEVLADAIPL